MYKNNIPTIDELKTRRLKYTKKIENDDIILLNEVIHILTLFPNFKVYIEDTGYDDQLELPYIIFGELMRYIEKCYNEGYNFEIQQILNHLGLILEKNYNYTNDLINAGVLENSCHYKKILPEIVNMMPKNLKELFLKYYSDYLK